MLKVVRTSGNLVATGVSSIIRQWRSWVLGTLLVGPVLVYVTLGTLWLRERGWLLIAAVLWILAGIAFSYLAVRWTKLTNPILPPLDWDSPETFSPRDRDAWAIVEREADSGEELRAEDLMDADLYLNTGRKLLNALAKHYHPFAADPLDTVPAIELLTALELAAEDLTGLCRQIPGGDLITLSHWKQAVKVAGYIQKANDVYSYLLPILHPVGGLLRLGAQEWISKPAWKSMQQNILQWFYQAYVNRLGVHLIELLSGRLAIGADQYRRVTRKFGGPSEVDLRAAELESIAVAVAGGGGSGKSTLLNQCRKVFSGDRNLIRARVASMQLDDPTLIDHLAQIRWVDVPSYSASQAGESRKDRAARAAALASVVECDLLLLVVDGLNPGSRGDIAFAQAWDRWFMEHPNRHRPPALVVVTKVDRIATDSAESWNPPYDWLKGRGPRERAVRLLFENLRAGLPPTFGDYVAVGLPPEKPFGVVEQILPALATRLHQAERAALIRMLSSMSDRSRAGRLAGQIGKHGRQLWSQFRSRGKKKHDVGPPADL